MNTAGLALGLALLFLSSCSHCKGFHFRNDPDERPVCRVNYQVTFPDNVVIELPDQFNLKQFLCIMNDNAYCSDNRELGAVFLSERGRKIGAPTGISLWRI
jgi:hypothetical protein